MRYRLLGMLVLSALVLGALMPVTAAAQTASPTEAPEEPSSDAPRYHGSDPDRDLQGYEPKPLEVVRDPEKVAGERDRRAVRLRPDAIELVRGAEVLRWVPFDASRTVSLAEVADALSAPGWIARAGPDVFELHTAFVQAPGTSVLFGGPDVRVVRLLDRPHVFLGGVGARAHLQGVRLTGWDPRRGGPDRDHEDGRPFVSYEDGSILDVVDSDVSHLGYDRVTAYGLSWRTGSTGTVEGSDIHHSFFGAYTFEARDIVYRDNVFRDNVYYGLDPHDYTTGLVVVGNEAYGNGSHGIIFSRGVVDGVVRGNHSHDNGGNGIVMDFESDRNVIEGNLVEDNAVDGIVVLGSSDVVVRDNLVRGNTVGVRLNGQGFSNLVERNRLVGNERGIQVYEGAYDTTLVANRVVGSTQAGIVLDETGVVSRRDVVEGGPIGLDVRGPSLVERTQVRGTTIGVRIERRAIAELRDLDVQATEIGVEVEEGAIARLFDSRVRSPDPVAGADLLEAEGNELTRPLASLPWLAIAGAAFVVLAFVFQVVHRVRTRRVEPRSREREMPPVVRGTS